MPAGFKITLKVLIISPHTKPDGIVKKASETCLALRFVYPNVEIIILVDTLDGYRKGGGWKVFLYLMSVHS